MSKNTNSKDIDVVETLILRATSTFTLKDIIGAMCFKHGLTKTINAMGEIAEELAEHNQAMADETRLLVNRKMPGSNETISEHYQNKASRLKTLQAGLSMATTLYKLAENSEPLTLEERCFVEEITSQLPISEKVSECTKDCGCSTY